MGKNQWVSPTEDGKWKVHGENNDRATKITDTKAEAIQIARKIAQNEHSELIIQKKDGTIESRDSHGKDPFPPRG